MTLYIGNSTYFEYTLTNPIVSPIYVNDATVMLTIYDRAGVALPSETWPQQLSYVAASDGEYRVTLSPLTDLVEDEIYTVVIVATGTTGLIERCETEEQAEVKAC